MVEHKWGIEEILSGKIIRTSKAFDGFNFNYYSDLKKEWKKEGFAVLSEELPAPNKGMYRIIGFKGL